MRHKRLVTAALAGLACFCCGAAWPDSPPDAVGNGPVLHVPSPDWRDQVIYFAMIDRFDDGDPANNDQGAGEYDPHDGRKFSGGDLAGLARRVGYLRGLGATALWITPPVANQWWDPHVGYGGYHGYWAEDFSRVDAHFGDLADYRQLSSALHGAGMYLIQDVVVNHVGNFFRYRGQWSPHDPTLGFERLADSRGRRAPTQPPFHLNDATDPEHRAAGIYHWTPTIRDFADREQELHFQLADLDDLDTENPAVRRALRASYGHWIREAGVDAFRIDTVFYVPPAYFRDFLHADDPEAPGIARVAAQTGRHDFHAFGEGFAVDRAYDDAGARKIEAYAGDERGPLLPGNINFPLYGTLLDVFARGRPSAELGWRIRSTMRVHRDPHRMPTFVDNHDVDRFLAGGSEAGLKQALLAILTLPGIPTIYYGTEQGFREQRAAMFAGGHGSGGRDHFDTDAPLYRYLQRAIALRRGNKVFSRGVPTVLAENAAAAGAIAWRMDHAGESALVLLNNAESPVLLDQLATGLPPGTRLAPLFAIEGAAPAQVVGSEGRITLTLPPRSGYAWRVDGRAEMPESTSAELTLTTSADMPLGGDFVVEGSARGVERFQLVVDGELAHAQPIVPEADGRWRARVDTASMVDPAVTHRLVAWSEEANAVSAPLEFRVQRDWRVVAQVDDLADDDRGPDGGYVYPTDPSWTGHRSLDIRQVRVSTAGGALKLDVRMADVIAAWNPANGFDHLALTVFVELPGGDGGARVMPQQNAMLPAGMRWHRRLRVHGWGNALFSSDGATTADDGTAISPSATLRIDRETDTISLVFPASALGRLDSLSGAKVYVTTWDYDGGYRGLQTTAGAHAFGGGEAGGPKVMDDTAVIVVP